MSRQKFGLKWLKTDNNPPIQQQKLYQLGCSPKHCYYSHVVWAHLPAAWYQHFNYYKWRETGRNDCSNSSVSFVHRKNLHVQLEIKLYSISTGKKSHLNPPR